MLLARDHPQGPGRAAAAGACSARASSSCSPARSAHQNLVYRMFATVTAPDHEGHALRHAALHRRPAHRARRLLPAGGALGRGARAQGALRPAQAARRRPSLSRPRRAPRRLRQREGEDRAAPRLALDPQPAAEVVDDLAADREPQAGARGLLGERVAHLAELLEDHALVLAADAHAVVAARRRARRRRPRATPHLDPARALRAELHRVGQQVQHHLHHAVAVGEHRRAPARGARLDASRRGS